MKDKIILIPLVNQRGIPDCFITRDDLPGARLTPGHASTCDPQEVLAKGFNRGRRKVPEGLKRRLFRGYKIPWSDRWRYDVDHLIPLCLGGSNDLINLWPHKLSAEHPPRLKMRLERRLLRMVRCGAMALKEAQDWIRGNWVAAFYRFCGDWRDAGRVVVGWKEAAI